MELTGQDQVDIPSPNTKGSQKIPTHLTKGRHKIPNSNPLTHLFLGINKNDLTSLLLTRARKLGELGNAKYWLPDPVGIEIKIFQSHF
jgi:hypothetical protein